MITRFARYVLVVFITKALIKASCLCYIDWWVPMVGGQIESTLPRWTSIFILTVLAIGHLVTDDSEWNATATGTVGQVGCTY
jgi:hypothetical protein